jgi:prepilin-type processing-associated H-X9-DG protein
MPISYVDINPLTGLRDKNNVLGWKVPGALTVWDAYYDQNGINANGPYLVAGSGANTIGAVTDGASNTVIVGEDSDFRNHESEFPGQISPAVDPTNVAAPYGAGITFTVTGLPTKGTNLGTPSGGRAINRWAEPETGNGISGPPYADPANTSGEYVTTTTSYAGPWVNQTYWPIGGTGTGPNQCVWSQNNCGPNDELASSHTGGCNIVFLDGHVAFLRDSVGVLTLRAIMTPAGNDQPESTADGF